MLYTADALYVGVRAFDSEPEHIRAEGLEGLSQPLRLELRPYTIVNSRSRAEAPGPLYDPGHQVDGDAGLDLKYPILPERDRVRRGSAVRGRPEP